MNTSGPWRDWYHIMCHTYGTWLPGDGRGFRTRHHREHVDGDYKSPPPAGKYDGLHRHAENSMKRDAVQLNLPQRQRAVAEIVRSFLKWQIELKILAITEIHLHALTRVPDHNPRHYMGLAKKECSAFMKRDGLALPGGLWAVRCECKPIADDRHFENAEGYIADHESQGAVIYPPRPPRPTINPMADFDPDSLLLEQKAQNDCPKDPKAQGACTLGPLAPAAISVMMRPDGFFQEVRVGECDTCRRC